ncbi:HTH-type transcriptional regulator RutR [Ancylobacter dichloromethanicus]|uniref:TetR family transcriptional regulator n=1 Tax=Ancylobacter dichloromethanicus TaxID=518825 RepID=A0A9W6N0M8_9HYPH|nr:HTH-type transcriptional regulator RutR [Ancylobacter dichloromethanicus]GLK73167.1 TetR family transcriptional regulator [Ancylobacter dichloromethanicus]
MPSAHPTDRPSSRKARPAAAPARAARLSAAADDGTGGGGRPKTPTRIKRIAAKRNAILDAALSLFSRYGLHGTTVEQIARSAAVSKTNLFYYFASKEEVYVGVLSRLLNEWLDPLRELQLETDPIEGISAYIRRKIRFSRTHPEASRLFCLEVVQGAPLLRRELETALKELVDAKTEVIRGWTAAGKLAPIDPHHLIFAIWATTQHYADFAPQIDALLGKGLDDEAFAEEATRNVQRIILDGLRAR